MILIFWDEKKALERYKFPMLSINTKSLETN